MRVAYIILLIFNAYFSFGQADSIYNNLQLAEKNPLSVKQLFLNDYKDNTMPKSIAKMRNLELLVFRNSSITEIPDFIGRFDKLTVLVLLHSKLSKVSDSISNLTNLERLELVGGNLTRIDSNICKLKKIQYLNLLGNKISYVSPAISNLTNLKMLNLRTWKDELLIDEKTKQMLINLCLGKCCIDI